MDNEFRQEFMIHLTVLSKAVDNTQPLVEYAGNFSALLNLLALQRAAETIITDIARILDEEEA